MEPTKKIGPGVTEFAQEALLKNMLAREARNLDELKNLDEYLRTQFDPAASLVETARQVAVLAHINQTQWNGDAYISHPIRVAISLRPDSSDDEQVVAFLHDVVEDTRVTSTLLKCIGFTDSQLAAIDSVTKRKGESYLDFILRSKANPIGCVVKIADINDNLRDLDGKRNKNHREKYQLALWILQH